MSEGSRIHDIMVGVWQKAGRHGAGYWPRAYAKTPTKRQRVLPGNGLGFGNCTTCLSAENLGYSNHHMDRLLPSERRGKAQSSV